MRSANPALDGVSPFSLLDTDFSDEDSRQFGGRQWLSERRYCALAVPSAVVPGERNCLLDPTHPDFTRIQIGPMQALDVDARLRRHFSR